MIVNAAKLAELEKTFTKVPSYKYGNKYKLAAGWIVEECGFKGQEHFGFALRLLACAGLPTRTMRVMRT